MKPPLNWKIKDNDGNHIRYRRGDVVSKNGKLYSATRTTTVEDGSPDEWYDTSSGKLYKYIDDETSKQWVEV